MHKKYTTTMLLLTTSLSFTLEIYRWVVAIDFINCYLFPVIYKAVADLGFQTGGGQEDHEGHDCKLWEDIVYEFIAQGFFRPEKGVASHPSHPPGSATAKPYRWSSGDKTLT